VLVFLNIAMKATYLLMKAFAARERDQVQRHLSRLYDLLNVNHPSSFIIRPLLRVGRIPGNDIWDISDL